MCSPGDFTTHLPGLVLGLPSLSFGKSFPTDIRHQKYGGLHHWTLTGALTPPPNPQQS